MAGRDARAPRPSARGSSLDRRSAARRLAPLRARPDGGRGSSAARLRSPRPGRPPSPATMRPAASIPSPVLAEISIRSRSARTCAKSILFNTKEAQNNRRIAVFSGRILQSPLAALPHRRGGIDQPQHEIGVLDPRQCPADPLGLDLAARLAYPRGIDEDHRDAAEVEMHLDDVARGARLVRDDRHVALGERIQQRLDLPALGGPAMTMRKPSRRRSPRWSARWRAISSRKPLAMRRP